MRLLSIRGTDIKCSPLLIAVLPAAYVMGRLGGLASAFAALSIHEAAHALSARRAGCAVDTVELQPFGFVAGIDCRYASSHDAAAIFAAGPIASLCLAAASALIARYLPALFDLKTEAAASMLSSFSDRNLVIAAVNMLPALPLDGGRLIRALADGSGRRLAAPLAFSGIVFGLAFICAFVFLALKNAINPTFLLMGVFLVIAAVKELAGIRAPAVRHKSLRPGEAMAVRQLAMSGEASLASAMRRLPTGAYAMVEVIDGSSRLIGTLDEGQLVSAAQSLGASATLGMAVAYCRRKVL